ncbi:ABC transporter ATP-binding protein [bacterium endosymbiont of Pedicinus badii]|uniref:ABC transporter ATP-binding protein n=1 Tax=bacterium endosymbiont of Pedicinus badii TaxID=1719126 RepID=UPI0009BAF0D6|nr:ABC transporter ATP-binding protein [bacterium endosymbiont of Pedicinus badii]OQM34235.1 hypothetical protein AOQ89_02785 [bacterium endosymbiont of Pedicinus badii]
MKYALEIKKLKKIYHSGRKALNKISMKVKIGDFYALLGPNGAGKSTTINIISSLMKKTSGKIKVFDTDIDKDPMKVKKNIGIVPQDFNFNPFETVQQIIIYQAGYYGIKKKLAFERTKKYLKKLDLWNKRKQISGTLSGGMKRRLMIARALVHKPKLLILDEPTAGLDIKLRKFVWKFLKKLNKSTTIILSTHYFEEAEILCKNIGILQNGNLIENTSMKELLKKLKVEIIILYLKKNINFLPIIKDYEIKIIDKKTISVKVFKNDGLTNLFIKLKKYNIEVLSMRNESNRLEKIFINLTK